MRRASSSVAHHDQSAPGAGRSPRGKRDELNVILPRAISDTRNTVLPRRRERMARIILHHMGPRFPVPSKLIEPSNALLRDPDACQAAWETDGCLLLRGVLDADLVADARLDLTRRLQRQGAVVAERDVPAWSGVPVSAIDAFELYEGDPAF